jgi:hypothetical protein
MKSHSRQSESVSCLDHEIFLTPSKTFQYLKHFKLYRHWISDCSLNQRHFLQTFFYKLKFRKLLFSLSGLRKVAIRGFCWTIGKEHWMSHWVNTVASFSDRHEKFTASDFMSLLLVPMSNSVIAFSAVSTSALLKWCTGNFLCLKNKNLVIKTSRIINIIGLRNTMMYFF